MQFYFTRQLLNNINTIFCISRLCECLISKFDTTYFCLTIFTVIALSLNLFQVSLRFSNFNCLIVSSNYYLELYSIVLRYRKILLEWYQ